MRISDGLGGASPGDPGTHTPFDREPFGTARARIIFQPAGVLDAATVDGQKCACSVDRKSREERK